MPAIHSTISRLKNSLLPRLNFKAGLIVFSLICVLFVVTNVSAFKAKPSLLTPLLKGYQLDGKPLQIEGLEDNASGLTYSPHSNTLFMAVNSPEQLYELSLSGDVLRVINLNGFEDTEGIAHIKGNRFALLEERRSEINFITIDEQTEQIKKSKSDRFALNIFQNSKKNLRLEGISIDQANGDIYLVKEKSPRALYKVSGLLSADRGVEITTPWDLEKNNNRMSDLSGLFFAPDSKRLLVLSHESFKLTEFSLSGQSIAEVKLNHSKHAQFKKIPQAEGVTISADGTLFIVSEPNLLYRFVNTETLDRKTAWSPSKTPLTVNSG